MENDSTAPTTDAQAAAPVVSEAQPTNTNAATETAAPTANIPADKIEEFNRFIDANGGYDKAFSKLKTDVSSPAPKPVEQPVEQPVQQPVQPQAQPRKIAGGISADEFLAMSYFDRLAADPKYATIADKIRGGEVLKEMADFGISPMVDGQINDGQVRKYLDLRAQTVPATPSGTPAATPTPTVDYVEVGETITSVADAQAVLQQNMTLKATGQAEHPQAKQAMEFLQKQYGLIK